MSAMNKSLRWFVAILLAGWVALGAAGVVYARFKNIPGWAAGPVIAAFLVAYSFYLVLGFPCLRDRLSGTRLSGFLLASAILPYLVCTLGGAAQFQWTGIIRLAAMVLAFDLWYRVLPRAVLVDLAFLALIPCVLLGGYLDSIYSPNYPGLRKELVELGHVALIQITVMVLLIERKLERVGYGFVPSRAEWRIGVVHYLCFVVIGMPLALAIGATRFATPQPLWKIAGAFFAFFWVVALSEEFLVRGVLQGWIEEWTRSQPVGLVITSVLFGLAHLFFRGFPNWRWALIAATLGWFCGHARNQAGSIRAGVVTHTLVITTWRAFLV